MEVAEYFASAAVLGKPRTFPDVGHKAGPGGQPITRVFILTFSLGTLLVVVVARLFLILWSGSSVTSQTQFAIVFDCLSVLCE